MMGLFEFFQYYCILQYKTCCYRVISPHERFGDQVNCASNITTGRACYPCLLRMSSVQPSNTNITRKLLLRLFSEITYILTSRIPEVCKVCCSFGDRACSIMRSAEIENGRDHAQRKTREKEDRKTLIQQRTILEQLCLRGLTPQFGYDWTFRCSGRGKAGILFPKQQIVFHCHAIK